MQVGTAVLLVWAGASKLAEPAPIRTTIAALGVPWAPGVAMVLGLAELAAGSALVLLPGSLLTALPIICLACAFGAAAALALVRKVQVDCACLTAAASAPLGWRQLAALPAWIVVAATVLVVPAWLPAERVTLALLTWSIVSFLILWRLVPLYIEHRAQRRAIDAS